MSADRAPFAFQSRMRQAVYAHAWQDSPLGPQPGWPSALKTLVDVMLDADQPMLVLWGPERTMIYNDGYAPILGARHPGALGRPFFEVWPELADDLAPIMSRAFAGEPIHMPDIRLVLHRNGYPEEAHFAFSYTPVRDEQQRVLGIFCPLRETTREVAANRTQAFWLKLERELMDLSEPAAIIATAQRAVGEELQAGRVGYGEVDFEARYFTTANNWTDGTIPHHNGTHDLAAFGPEIWNALKAGEPLSIDDVTTDPRFDSPEARAAFAALQMRSVLTASLIKGGRMIAAMYVHDGRPRRWTAADRDLVLQVAERTWSALTRASAESQMARVLQSMAEGFILLDRRYRVTAINPEGLRLDGRERSAILGRTHWELWPGTEDSALGAMLRKAMETARPAELEHSYHFVDGRSLWFETRAYPTDQGLAVFYRDVSERKAAEERLELLMREVDHRANNLMSVIQGAVRLSRADDADTLRSIVLGRVDALARAHQLLAASRWNGADLRQLVEEEVRAFVLGDLQRVEIQGPSLPLNPALAQGLAMAVHELTTNAVKHGALAGSSGRVKVSWTAHGGVLRLVWEEAGGPPVRRPAQLGFGTTVLERALRGAIGGTTTLTWREEGLTCLLEAPLTNGASTPSEGLEVLRARA
ncbi:PAS domain-containing protein [Phenylobacterium sp.]|uniref:PAS domain-containing protein n=1 Tax=Phenylobacterium sp. TaxID=1871053 RepID=UPI002E307569|nr:PAS domain-containing protein [Phenylobacterium sp.]HEX2560612.1 PAS domain-containing protein [Phenylobacterium sp.]